jgi:hypothetical protein
MPTDTVHCNQCGAALSIAPTTNFVTCNRCGAQLAVKRTADATFTEPASGEAMRQVADHLGAIAAQNELANIDRQWEIERENYMISDRWGRRSVPSAGLSLVGGVVIVVFGIFWTVMAATITGGFAEAGGPRGLAYIFPLFGVLFIVVGIGVTAYSYTKSRQYQQAYRAYQRRREEAARRLHAHEAPPPAV